MQFKGIEIIRAESLIPRGSFCYTPVKEPCVENNFAYQVKRCRFHGFREDQPGQENGTCSYLKIGDATEGTLLWDSTKEGGINEDVDMASPTSF